MREHIRIDASAGRRVPNFEELTSEMIDSDWVGNWSTQPIGSGQGEPVDSRFSCVKAP